MPFRRFRLALGALAAVAVAAAFLTAARAAAEPPLDDIVVTPGEPAELTVWNRPIVTLRANLGHATPAERASAAASRIEDIPDTELGQTVRVVPARVAAIEGLMTYVGARNVFAILKQDLDVETGETLDTVGPQTERRLREVLDARAAQRSLPQLLRGIGLSLLATLVFALIVWGLVRARRWSHRRMTRAAERRAGKALRHVRGYFEQIARRAEQLMLWLFGLLAFYVLLTFILSQFPYTQPWGETLGEHLEALLAHLAIGTAIATPGLLTVVIILIVARFAVRVLRTVFDAVEARRLRLTWLQPETVEATRRISTVLIWLFAITIAYPYIPGSETPAFRGVSVFVGLMLSLGSAGLVNQVMSGLVVVYARAVRPGEYVRIGEVEGIVSEVGLLSTKLTTVRREEITIPNTVMVATTTTNYSRMADAQGGIVATSVTIGYDAPWRQVEAMLVLAADRTASIRKQPPPRVMQRKLDDFYVEYTLLVHVDRPDQRPTILSELHAQIQDAFNEFGVQIMSPHFLSQPDGAVVVPRAKWFTSPAKPPPE